MSINIISPDFEFLKNGLVEILGQQGFDSLVTSKGKDSETLLLGDLNEGLIKQFGALPAKGFALRAGRSAFYYWMRQYAVNYGWREPEFRYRPTRAKIKQGLHDLGNWFDINANLKITFQDTEKYWNLSIVTPFHTSAIETEDFLAGIFQEFMVWAGSGRFYQVKTTIKPNILAQDFHLALYKEAID
jgi:hypothetical protein